MTLQYTFNKRDDDGLHQAITRGDVQIWKKYELFTTPHHRISSATERIYPNVFWRHDLRTRVTVYTTPPWIEVVPVQFFDHGSSFTIMKPLIEELAGSGNKIMSTGEVHNVAQGDSLSNQEGDEVLSVADPEV